MTEKGAAAFFHHVLANLLKYFAARNVIHSRNCFMFACWKQC